MLQLPIERQRRRKQASHIPLLLLLGLFRRAIPILMWSSRFVPHLRRGRQWSHMSGTSALTWPRHFVSRPPSREEEKDTPTPPTDPPKPAAKPTSIVPGLALSAAVATAGFTAASSLSVGLGLPLSGIPVSILLGMAVRNSDTGLYSDAVFQPGLTYASKTVLQGGIVCVASKLSFLEVITTGVSSIPVVLAAVGAGLFVIPRVGAYAGLPPHMTLLLTAGTSICGVTAITALAPAIHAPPRDIAVAVANTVAFGTLGMLVYPYLFHTVCATSAQAGMCLGVAIHDTSQVLGAALSYKEAFDDQTAFQVAAVTKLLRNLGLAVAIPALTYSYHASLAAQEKDASDKEESPSTLSGLPTFTKYVPPFLYAFLGMSALRSVGDVYLADVELFTTVMNLLGNDLSKYALGTAMAAVGLSTSASSLRGVGWKPFAVGGIGALAVGGTGFSVAMLMV